MGWIETGLKKALHLPDLLNTEFYDIVLEIETSKREDGGLTCVGL